MKIRCAGAEVLYPQPYGLITAGAEKDYPVDLSYFNIMGMAVGAHGVEATSDAAVFSNVDLEVAIGSKKDVKLKLPFIIPGLGSTAVAKNNWEGLAVGAPYFKIIGMARGPIAAAMVGKTIGNAVKSKEVPVYISRFGRTIEDIFVTSTELKHRFGADFDSIPAGAIGLYTYMQRIAQGMRS